MNRHFTYLFCFAVAAGTAHAANDVSTEADDTDIVDCGSLFLGNAEKEECENALSDESESLADAADGGMRILPVIPTPVRPIPWRPIPSRPKPRPHPSPFPLPAKHRYLCVARNVAVEAHLRGRITGHVGTKSSSLAQAKRSALAVCKVTHERCEISKCYRAKP